MLLDRDGTINVDHGYVHDVEEWEFLPGAITALARLQHAGFTLAIVTNQSGIAAGRFTSDDVAALHAYVVQELARHGVAIAAIACCPHSAAEGCACRKPATGLARQIEAVVGTIDYPASWVVGDKLSDVEFGRRLGARSALIRSRYWVQENNPPRTDLIIDSLSDLARHIAPVHEL